MEKDVDSKHKARTKQVASPIATGGGGPNYERHVGAYYLALLLLRAMPYGQRAGKVVEVRFQRLYAGDPLDDLIVVSESVTGKTKLALQIKRDLGFGKEDSTFDEVLRACWETFTSDQFIRGTDQFGVVIALYTKQIDEHYPKTLDWARDSVNAADFFARIAHLGLANQSQRTFVELIRSKLTSYAGSSFNEEALWHFLCALVILRLDLHLRPSKDQTRIVEMLKNVLPPERREESTTLFIRLSEYAGELAETAGSMDFATLVKRLHADGIPVVWPSPDKQENLAIPETLSVVRRTPQESPAFIAGGRFRLLKQFSIGTFGSLYLVEQKDTGASVVLKVLSIPQGLRLGYDMFALGTHLIDLHHPSILSILEVNLDGIPPYVVASFAAGGSLAQRLQQNTTAAFPLPEAFAIIKQVGQALAYLHQQRIVHRGVQPGSIVFDQAGHALLTGFDLAMLIPDSGHNLPSYQLGAMHYMAPEQLSGLISEKCDQYSLGCVAYELCTGRRYKDAGSPPASERHHQTRSPRQLNPALPMQAEQAILRAIEANPDFRYDTIEEFVASFDTL